MKAYLLKPLKLFFFLLSPLAPALALRVAERLFVTPPFSKRQESEIKLLEKAETFFVDMEGGHRLAVYRWGKRDDPVILFVHGWTATATCFVRFIERLVADGYQVVSYDAIAHGGSSGRTTSLPEWADSVRAVLEVVGPVRAAIGHSLGAMALIVASSHLLNTQRLVLISPATNVDEILNQFAKTLSLPEKIREALPAYLWRKYGHIAQKYGDDWEDIFVSDWPGPSLIIHDVKDKEVGVHNARWLAARWPLAELVETNGLGHRRILLSEEIIDLTRRFIKQKEAEAEL